MPETAIRWIYQKKIIEGSGNIMTQDSGKNSNRLLILLLLADFVFILIHLLFSKHLFSNPLFSIEMDRGYAEVYQYIKEFWILVLLCFMALKNKQIIYFGWSILFMYLLFDDSLQIHERLGSILSNRLHLQPGFALRADDIGQIGASALFGILLFSVLGFAYLLSDDTAKQVSKRLFILVVCVAFFGVVVDMFHVAIPGGGLILGIIEDGGEMVIMSMIVSYVFDQGAFQRLYPKPQRG